ncbi:nitrite reductase small subunit NirD [Arenicella xantha]|uniref:Nitrite reductase (NADH) small subunit n=1 Tax=Arenicella xantha TaxID=644221 RepID=A0A395JP71_9GAMM|nr:nitrite reductase small subunit NirD [Arenicella xantha]RBP53451.1 nitrite reductase (NADH) small subunit [Arenicella xantha]
MSQQIICTVSDLVVNSGVCALVEVHGEQKQVALFYLPETEQKLYALDNWDPLGNANVLSRGIVGSVGDELVVASPLYKQHFSLSTGDCIEADASVSVYPARISGAHVVLGA